MFSDVFVTTGFGLIEPILAIFIMENLAGGTIFAAGIASMLFLLTKCAVQLPFSKYVDCHEHKEIWLMIGTGCIAIVPFIYTSAKDISAVYFAQVFYGLGSGLAYPTWLGLWSTHLDRNHESFEWSLYSTVTGLGAAGTAAIGAAIAEFMGFKYTFIAVGAMSMLGCAVLFGLETQNVPTQKPHIHHYQKKRKLVHKRHH